MYFTATYNNGVGREDIYLSRYVDGRYTEPEPLDTMVNSVLFEFNAYISPDEDLLIFSSFGRQDGLGGGDLYISVKDSFGNWTKARNLGPELNSDRLDYCPFVDMARKNFYFTSNRISTSSVQQFNYQLLKDFNSGPGNGQGDIYNVALNQILSD